MVRAISLILVGFTAFWFFKMIYEFGKNVGEQEQFKKDTELHKKLSKFKREKRKGVTKK